MHKQVFQSISNCFAHIDGCDILAVISCLLCWAAILEKYVRWLNPECLLIKAGGNQSILKQMPFDHFHVW